MLYYILTKRRVLYRKINAVYKYSIIRKTLFYLSLIYTLNYIHIYKKLGTKITPITNLIIISTTIILHHYLLLI